VGSVTWLSSLGLTWCVSGSVPCDSGKRGRRRSRCYAKLPPAALVGDNIDVAELVEQGYDMLSPPLSLCVSRTLTWKAPRTMSGNVHSRLTLPLPLSLSLSLSLSLCRARSPGRRRAR
jgi:hypothetical protein